MRYGTAAFLILSLAASCTRDPDEASDAAPLADAGPRADATPGDDAASPAQIGGHPTLALQGIVSAVLSLGPERLQRRFDDLLAQGDEACPPREITQEPGLVSTFIEADCVADSGARFTGDITYTLRQDAPEGEGGRASGFVLEGGPLVMEGADGTRLTVQGYHELRRIDYPASTEASVTWQGLAAADPSSAAGDPWLLELYSGSLDAYTYADETGYHSLRLTAELAGIVQAPEAALEEVRLQSEACVSGRWRLTDSEGARHVLRFGAEDALPCDACAEHVVDGQDAPPFCLEPEVVAGMLFWGPRPW